MLQLINQHYTAIDALNDAYLGIHREISRQLMHQVIIKKKVHVDYADSVLSLNYRANILCSLL